MRNGAMAKPRLPPTINIDVARPGLCLGVTKDNTEALTGWNSDEHSPTKNTMSTSVMIFGAREIRQAKIVAVAIDSGIK